jgi:hypothetical protein
MTKKLPTYYFLPATELQIASVEEIQTFFRRAEAFVNSTNFYRDAKSVAVPAVAEYMAYLEDKTIRIRTPNA